MEKETKHEFENLGRMVKNGFDQVDKRFNELDQRLSGRIDGLEQTMSAHFTTIENDIAEIKKNIVYRQEFDGLTGRASYVEKKLKIKSGR